MEYNFRVSYTDAAKFVRPMVLTVWVMPGDRIELQIYDSGPKKLFLKRGTVPEKVDLANLTLNATVVINARAYKVEGYADAITQRIMSSRGSSLCLVLPEAYNSMGRVIEYLEATGVGVGRLRLVNFTEGEAAEFLSVGEARGAPQAPPGTSKGLSRGSMLAIECVGEDVCSRLQEAVGPLDIPTARDVAPQSLRALFNAVTVRVSSCVAAASAEVARVFDRSYPYTAVYTNCSAVIIKPHAVSSKCTGPILNALLSAGVEVSALRSVALSRTDAADFLEPYKSVVPEFERWVVELSSGVSVCIEARGEGVVEMIRDLAGPVDVAVSRILAPQSLRARFAVDNVRTAVQVTDVTEDGPLECKFLFSVVA